MIDELGHSTTYTYDDYQRLTSVTPPIRGDDDTTAHTTRYYYDRNYDSPTFPAADYYKHTAAEVTCTILPSGKKQITKYDNNCRKTDDIVGSGAEQATTHYDYDLVGNLRKVRNPLTHTTEFFYDARNRLIGVNDPIAGDRDTVGNGPHHTVSYGYDPAGNKTSELRANNELVTYGYDNMNRLTSQTVPRLKDLNDPNPDLLAPAVTQWQWKPFGQLEWTIDPRGQKCDYLYDGMNRRTQTTYPGLTPESRT